MSFSDYLPELYKIAAGRDHLATDEMGQALNATSQNIRKNFSQTGSCFGIVPVKVGNRLLWPVADIVRLLSTGSKRISVEEAFHKSTDISVNEGQTSAPVTRQHLA